jgi:gluconolactonase
MMTKIPATLLLASACIAAQTPSKHSVVGFDPSFANLVSPDAKLEVAARGFGFTEGNTWVQHGKVGYLLFVDIPMNNIYKLSPDGKVSVFLEQAGWTKPINGYDMLHVGTLKDNSKPHNDPDYRQFINIGADGLTLDMQGRLIICTYAGRSIVRLEKDGTHTLLADNFNGKRLNGTNDVIVKRDGAIYFSDMLGGLRDGEKDPNIGMLIQGIYLLRKGKVSLVVQDMPSVNGLALSPDEKILYVNSGHSNTIRAYDVAPDDTLSNGRLLIDQSTDKTFGYTDGMRVDSLGNIYATGPGGIWITSPQGQHLATILVPEKASNLTFGDADYKTLYIDGTTSIYKIRVLTGANPCNSCTPPKR